MNQTEDSIGTELRSSNQALEFLASKKQIWATMPPAERLVFLRKIEARLQEVDHEAWGQNAARAYGYDPGHPAGDPQAAVESMVNASMSLGTVRHLIRTVSSRANTGQRPALDSATISQRTVVRVFPTDRSDAFTPEGMAGCTGEVWLRPGRNLDERLPQENGRVCLVLGAGNQSFLAFGDVMYQLFVEGSVCVLKHHPVRSFCAPYFDEIFADLISEGFFHACEGDVAESQELIHHALVDHVHMTGGTATHDAIVWGETIEIQNRNKAAGTPVLNKPMSSELGCITPWMIVPGTQWTPDEIAHMAGHFVAAFVAQNSCNCLSPKLLVIDENWPQRTEFLDAIRAILCKTAAMPPHYPGTAQRYRGFVEAYPSERIERIHSPDHPGMAPHELGPCLPWLLVHLDENASTYALENEAFAPVLGIYTLSSGNDPERFLDAAVHLVNESVWGSLSCTLIAHPDLPSGPSSAVERAIANLRYGSIGLNIWTASVYGTRGLTWGAYPGEPLDAVASGRGIVRNAYALAGVEKSVLRSPFQSKTRLVIGPDGRPATTSGQIRAIRRMVVRPGLGSTLRMVREMIRSNGSKPKRRFRPVFRLFEKLLMWVEGRINRRAKLDFHPSQSPFLRGNFAPTKVEHQRLKLDIEGTLPPDLEGSFLRIGPNQKYPPKGVYHFFDGDGMVHALRFRDGEVRYSNGWVRTHKMDVEDAAGRNVFVNIGEMTGGVGLAKIILQVLRTTVRVINGKKGAGRANTTVIRHAGRLLALHEGDAPYEIEFTEEGHLKTLGRLTFDGRLKSPFTAHPKFDPRTGELLFFAYDLYKEPRCVVGTLDADGALAKLFPVEMDEPRMMHDCAFTENYLILVSPPLIFRPKEMVKNKTQPITMDPSLPIRMGVLSRAAKDAEDIRWFEFPAGGVFHVLNAWEDGESCTVYACRSETIELGDFATVGNLRVPDEATFQLYRFVLDLQTGNCTQTPVIPPGISVDFPVMNPKYQGIRSRYGYLTRLRSDIRVVSLVKVDLERTGENVVTAEYHFGDGCYGGECTFVARRNAETEDDGYLLVHIRDENQGRSYVDIIDARTMNPDPIARVRVPARVPYGFHCTWIPGDIDS